MMSKSAAPNTNSSRGGARHEVPSQHVRHGMTDTPQQLGAPQPQPQLLLHDNNNNIQRGVFSSTSTLPINDNSANNMDIAMAATVAANPTLLQMQMMMYQQYPQLPNGFYLTPHTSTINATMPTISNTNTNTSNDVQKQNAIEESITTTVTNDVISTAASNDSTSTSLDNNSKTSGIVNSTSTHTTNDGGEFGVANVSGGGGDINLGSYNVYGGDATPLCREVGTDEPPFTVGQVVPLEEYD